MTNQPTYLVKGGNRLMGSVPVSGSKNAALGVVAAAMLLDGPCRIENVPRIADIEVLLDICRSLGAQVDFDENNVLHVDPTTINTYEAVNDSTRSIRASYYLQGALLGRYGRARLSFPGGCNFGTRPIDLHKKGFEALGATVNLSNGIFQIEGQYRRGGSIYLDQVSVGATINLMIAATKTPGLTTIENAAREPHIVDVANFLNTMGANIKGAGTDVVRITGVPVLPGGSTYSIIPDQIEAGTFMIAAAVTHGDVKVTNLIPRHMEPLTAKLIEMGVEVETGEDYLRVSLSENAKLRPTFFKTMPYPGFPTDLQPQTVILLCIANGMSKMFENVWENRFQYIDELKKMGADITVAGKVALVNGPAQMTGAHVRARDLRAGAAMVLAGLMSDGVTEISDVHVIDRGYEDFVGKLQRLGADIQLSNG